MRAGAIVALSEWLLQNWGNLASVVGVGLSLWAMWIAGTAKRQVRLVAKRNQRVTLIMALQQAETLCTWIATSDRNQSQCDQLRQLLSRNLTHQALAVPELELVAEAVNWLQFVPVE
jgi:hypothetical protein